MAGGSQIKIKGGIASKGEATVEDGALLVTGLAAGGFQLNFYGEDAGAAVASLNLHGINDDGIGVVLADKVLAAKVAVTFRRTHIPPGPGAWTLRLTKFNTVTEVAGGCSIPRHPPVGNCAVRRYSRSLSGPCELISARWGCIPVMA